MQLWGTTAAGRIRWYCSVCHQTQTRRRPDVIRSNRYGLFVRWLIGTQTLTDIAQRYSVTLQTLNRWFLPFWTVTITPVFFHHDIDVLIIDGLYVESRSSCVLIGKTPTAVTHWVFVERECYGAWRSFCCAIKAPSVVVCDGQRGMRAALRDTWPKTRIQRCIIHIYRLSTGKLTRRPKTDAGYDLRLLMHALLKVRTRRQKRRWLRAYRTWEKHYNYFLKERTIGQQPGKKRTWWYTHRNIRSVRALIDNAIPDLFTYIGHHEIPRSTNYVEGGINSRLKELLHRHRGLSVHKKEVLVATFLSRKQGQKPTRNVN